MTTPVNIIEISPLNEFPSRAEGIRFLLGCSNSQLKKAELPKKWLEASSKKGETWKLPIDLVNSGKISPSYTGPQTCILAESEHFLAIHKPSNLHSHPLRYSDSNTALNALYTLGREELLEINTSNYDRSLLYRLDFETSGVVIFAKSDEVYSKIREHFSTLAKEKSYLAVVVGKFSGTESLTHYFKSSGPGGEKQKVFDSGVESKAELTVTALDYSEIENLTLVKVKLKTGLRHQIRAQLAHIGFPLLGDELYGGKKSERLFLHAYEYSLEFDGKVFSVKDSDAELFNRFFDLNRTL